MGKTKCTVPKYEGGATGGKDGISYSLWKLRMRTFLQAEGLWTVIQPPAPTVEKGKDGKDVIMQPKAASAADKQLVLSYLVEALGDQQVLLCADAANDCNPKAMWDTVAAYAARNTEENKALLIQQFFQSGMLPTEKVLDYAARLKELVMDLRQIDPTAVSEDLLTQRFLAGVEADDRFRADARMIKTLPASEQTLDKIITKLRGFEASEAIKEEQRVMMTGARQHGRPVQQGGSGGESNRKDKSKVKCYNCKKFGHYKRECTRPTKDDKVKPKDKEKSRQNDKEVVMMAVPAAAGRPISDRWYWDCGATSHVVCKLDWMEDFRSFAAPRPLALGNTPGVMALGIGTVRLTGIFKGEKCNMRLINVLYAPDFGTNVISASKAGKNGFRGITDGHQCIIENIKTGQAVAGGMEEGGLYRLLLRPVVDSISMVTGDGCNKASVALWHRRYGHIAGSTLMKMARDGVVQGLCIEGDCKDSLCEGCAKGKQARFPFSKVPREKSPVVLGRIHSDVAGPFSKESLQGCKYYVTFIDDKTSYTTVYFLRSKAQVFTYFKQYKAYAENKHGAGIKILRSDNGGEYTSQDFESFLTDHGIKHETTVPDTPEQNGVAERANRSLVEMMRCMLHSSGLGKGFWQLGLQAAVYIKNLTPTRSLGGMTPWEAWHGTKPDVSHLRVFGSKAYAHVPKDNRRKLDSKTQECVLVGYSEDSKGYLLWDSAARKVIVRRDVLFDEPSGIPKAGIPVVPDEPIKLTTRTVPTLQSREPIRDEPANADLDAIPDLVDGWDSEDEFEDSDPEDWGDAEDRLPSEPDHDAGSKGDDEHVNVTTRSKWPSITTRSGKNAGVQAAASRTHNAADSGDSIAVIMMACAEAADANEDDPLTMTEALSRPDGAKWKAALDEEYESLVKNKTWSLVPLPPGRRPVGFKWVFKVKRNADGTVERYKARGVARGFSQQEGIDYEETFAPVAKFTSFRLLFAMAAAEGLPVSQVDIVTAFLNGDIDEEIYMQQPHGYEVAGKENYVCRLHKSLYGLKQAARCWNIKMHEAMVELGFMRIEADRCVYVKLSDDGKTVVAVHVDDMLVAASTAQRLSDFINSIKTKFSVKVIGEPKLLLGVQVARDDNTGAIKLSQEGYINTVLRRFNMADCHARSTPLPERCVLTKAMRPATDGEREEMRQMPYASAVGSLMYLMVATRPDIAQAVGALSKFISDPGQQHWEAAKHVLRYLKGTASYGIVYRGGGSLTVEGYTDSDYAGNTENRKSTSGFIYTANGSAISWGSKQQECVTTSSTEAEYVATCKAVKEAMWLRQLLGQLGYDTSEAMTIYADNQASIKLAKNPALHQRTKHIDVQYHYTRECVENGEVELVYCSTDSNVADMCTKALGRIKVTQHREAIGMAE